MPVEVSERNAPTIPVVDEGGSIRFLKDYKVTLNTVSKPDSYPFLKRGEVARNLSSLT
jgi:hypothetical protein